VQVAVEPEKTPAMKTEACPVEGETNAGLRALLDVPAAGCAIVMVPLTFSTVVFGAVYVLEPPPPPEHAASDATLAMQASLRRSMMGLSW
jgi:hypothetical protein